MNLGAGVQSGSIVESGRGKLVSSLPFTDGEYERRLSAVRRIMAQRGLDVFISFTPENLNYLTAHDTPGYYFYQACVLTHDRRPINVLRGIESTNTFARGWARLAVVYEDTEDPVLRTLELLRELTIEGKRVGLESDAWFVQPRRYQQLRGGISKLGGTIVDETQLIESLRMIKSAEEVEHLRKAARITSTAMGVAFDHTHANGNENSATAAFVANMIASGSEYEALPPFVASGPRTTLCHATWAGRTFETGDVVTYELHGTINRYCAPLMRTGVIGTPNRELQSVMEAIHDSLQSVIEFIKPGVTSAEVNEVDRGAFARHGVPKMRGHRTGYSVGLSYPPDTGEGHIISIIGGDTRALQAGMVFHLVPAYLVLGKYSACTSETVLVTENGCEILTDFRRELIRC